MHIFTENHANQWLHADQHSLWCKIKWFMMFKIHNHAVLEQENLTKFSWNCPTTWLAAMMNSSSLPSCNLKLKNDMIPQWFHFNTISAIVWHIVLHSWHHIISWGSHEIRQRVIYEHNVYLEQCLALCPKKPNTMIFV